MIYNLWKKQKNTYGVIAWTKNINGHKCTLIYGECTKKYLVSIDVDVFGYFNSFKLAQNEINKRIMNSELSSKSLSMAKAYRKKFDLPFELLQYF